jgi:UDP-glucose 4-epimerase
MKKKNILVTGGSGFLGSHVADFLSNKGFNVIIYDKKKSKWLKSNQKFISGDILNLKKLKKIKIKIDYIYHFAALSDLDTALKNPIESIKINILGTVKLLKFAVDQKIKRFFLASTIYANSSQGSFYAASKKASEEYLREYSKLYKLKFTILRFGSLYGERADKNNGLNKIIYTSKKNGRVIFSGNKKTVREYINVKDAAKACLQILKKEYENDHVLITGKHKIKITNFLAFLKNKINSKKKTVIQNKKIVGHYIKSPYTSKFFKGRKIKLKSYLDFYDSLNKLI